MAPSVFDETSLVFGPRRPLVPTYFACLAVCCVRPSPAENGNRKGGGYAAWATSRKRGKTDPDSHNYEPDESEVWRTHQAQRHFRDRGRCVQACSFDRLLCVMYARMLIRKRTLFVRYCKWRIFASFSLVEGGTRSTNKATAVDGRREERRVPSVDRNVEPEGRVVLGNGGHSNRSSVARTEWNGGETLFWSDGLVLPPVYVEQVMCWSVGLVLSTYINSVLSPADRLCGDRPLDKMVCV